MIVLEDYKKMYYSLFNKITDVINELQNIQQQTEEIFMTQDKSDVKICIFECEKDNNPQL